MKYYPLYGTKIAAKHMPKSEKERSINAISQRARRINLRCNRSIQRDKEIAIIAAIYSDGKPLHNKRSVLATGLTKSQVCHICIKNGIVKKK